MLPMVLVPAHVTFSTLEAHQNARLALVAGTFKVLGIGSIANTPSWCLTMSPAAHVMF